MKNLKGHPVDPVLVLRTFALALRSNTTLGSVRLPDNQLTSYIDLPPHKGVAGADRPPLPAKSLSLPFDITLQHVYAAVPFRVCTNYY